MLLWLLLLDSERCWVYPIVAVTPLVQYFSRKSEKKIKNWNSFRFCFCMRLLVRGFWHIAGFGSKKEERKENIQFKTAPIKPEVRVMTSSHWLVSHESARIVAMRIRSEVVDWRRVSRPCNRHGLRRGPFQWVCKHCVCFRLPSLEKGPVRWSHLPKIMHHSTAICKCVERQPFGVKSSWWTPWTGLGFNKFHRWKYTFVYRRAERYISNWWLSSHEFE